MTLSGESQQRFEDLHTQGLAAKEANEYERSLELFESADQLAQEHHDPRKRLDALQPAARALWTMERYDEAAEKLHTASGISGELDLTDEKGSIISNLGRLAASKVIHTVPVEQQRQALHAEAVPSFRSAFDTLHDHPHLYYRYANAQHGSVVAAMAGDRKLAAKLVSEGVGIAFHESEEPYDQKRTYNISSSTRRGLGQMLVAIALIPLGDRTPVLAQLARDKFMR